MYKQYPNLLFDPILHAYLWKGAGLLSVTQILSSVAVKRGDAFVPIVGNFFKNNESARVFGKGFHAIIAGILAGKTISFPEPFDTYIEQWHKWRELRSNYSVATDEEGRFLVEYPLCSTRFHYAGTLDAVFEMDNELLLVDWKTATAEMDYWDYQTAAYEVLLREVFPELTKNKIIIRESVRFEENRFHPEQRKNHPEDWIVFQSAHNLLKAV
jgi:hypothetical protein